MEPDYRHHLAVIRGSVPDVVVSEENLRIFEMNLSDVCEQLDRILELLVAMRTF